VLAELQSILRAFKDVKAAFVGANTVNAPFQIKWIQKSGCP
jgi:hypothetical protein